VWYVLAIAVVMTSLVAVLVLASWQRPSLGLEAGRLRPCPASPNCVCSQDADAAHAIEPLPFTGDSAAAIGRLRTLLADWPRTRIVVAEGDYLWVEVSTPLLGFVDDVEFLLDRSGVIHVRSASRVGRSDLGANRSRVAALRAAFSKSS
jgi:uncharacterized protein (DUF1499 family)